MFDMITFINTDYVPYNQQSMQTAWLRLQKALAKLYKANPRVAYVSTLFEIYQSQGVADISQLLTYSDALASQCNNVLIIPGKVDPVGQVLVPNLGHIERVSIFPRYKHLTISTHAN